MRELREGRRRAARAAGEHADGRGEGKAEAFRGKPDPREELLLETRGPQLRGGLRGTQHALIAKGDFVLRMVIDADGLPGLRKVRRMPCRRKPHDQIQERERRAERSLKPMSGCDSHPGGKLV